MVNNFLQFFPVDGAQSSIYTGKMIVILPNGFSSLLNISLPRSRFCLVTQGLSPFCWCTFIKCTRKKFPFFPASRLPFSFAFEELTRKIPRNRHFVSDPCLLTFARWEDWALKNKTANQTKVSFVHHVTVWSLDSRVHAQHSLFRPRSPSFLFASLASTKETKPLLAGKFLSWAV